ncbi:lysosome-associated membrane glycoprotein 1a [Cyprinodon tularosa]|uniref:lysosome-associated membrane glycoprotein 1a n=1 Tax=Cyprinodon tularosa TaxID=77115 RepID=UPI0018E26425|nr:lysosome-associated membrane glycoprotein 1a [Cyprinodon tularosa]XP_038139865.1 lysosome-associated membrane glycoprotein 1a [Cyprinodon tularosa]
MNWIKEMPVIRCLVLLLIACFGFLDRIQAVTLEVKVGNSTCIKAELSALLSITYTTSNSTSNVSISLPDSTSVDAGSSSCGTDSRPPWLVAVFGSGHALGLSFSTNGSFYNVTDLMLQYNLSDTLLFPEANGSGVVTVMSTSVRIWAPVNTTYRCASPTTIRAGGAAVTFSEMRLEAYMPGNDLSPAESVCAADQTTTAAPPTSASTTVRTTTAAPGPTPPGTPQTGTFSVRNGSGDVCLLAKMGLQLNVSYVSQSQNKTVQELFNVNPNLTAQSGSCGSSTATLVITQQATTLSFTFSMNLTTSQYHLSGINLLANWSDMSAPFSASNSSLDYLPSKLGHSYMCNTEQTLLVVPDFSINTFRLQVQPFGVTAGQFSAAEECQLDQDQMLIPIIVGAALAGLVLIVLIAYLIGRKRSHAGYQTI